MTQFFFPEKAGYEYEGTPNSRRIVRKSMRFGEKTGQLFDLMKFALETDSTRIISLLIDTTVIHNITHRGGRPEVIDELRDHEERQFEVLNSFLTALAETKEVGTSLLDRPQVLYDTCMGSANPQSIGTLPVRIVGGDPKHDSIWPLTRRTTTRRPIYTVPCSGDWQSPSGRVPDIQRGDARFGDGLAMSYEPS